MPGPTPAQRRAAGRSCGAAPSAQRSSPARRRVEQRATSRSWSRRGTARTGRWTGRSGGGCCVRAVRPGVRARARGWRAPYEAAQPLQPAGHELDHPAANGGQHGGQVVRRPSRRPCTPRRSRSARRRPSRRKKLAGRRTRISGAAGPPPPSTRPSGQHDPHRERGDDPAEQRRATAACTGARGGAASRGRAPRPAAASWIARRRRARSLRWSCVLLLAVGAGGRGIDRAGRAATAGFPATDRGAHRDGGHGWRSGGAQHGRARWPAGAVPRSRPRTACCRRGAGVTPTREPLRRVAAAASGSAPSTAKNGET